MEKQLPFSISDETITSLRNPSVQALVRLQRSKERIAQRRFLIEGEHALLESLAANWPLEGCIATERWVESHSKTLREALTRVSMQLVSEEVLRKIASTESPDGVVAIGRIESTRNKTSSLPSLGLAFDRIQDPGNAGTLIRSAIACNADGVYLGEGSVDPFNSKVIRSTAGQWFRKPPIEVSLREWIAQCRKGGVQVLAAEADGKSFWEMDFTQPTLFLLGNEGSGISEELRASIDETVSVPMANKVESLNVAMTGTLLLYEAFRQRS